MNMAEKCTKVAVGWKKMDVGWKNMAVGWNLMAEEYI